MTGYQNKLAYAASNGSQFTTFGTSWAVMDPSLTTTFTPTINATAMLTANADVFTASAGTNQDVGICLAMAATITAGCANGNIVAWEENGGAAAYMPIAALVETTTTLVANTQYTAAVVWRSNQGNGNVFYAGAGSNPNYSLSSILVQIAAASDSQVSSASAATQLTRSFTALDDGSGWAAMPTTPATIALNPTTNSLAFLSGNTSLFANTAALNVDVGICIVAVGTGTCPAAGVVVWRETGSAVAFSPDASYANVAYALTANTSYTAQLVWRTNVKMVSGNEIFSGAGSTSPTTLTAFVVPYTVPGAPAAVTATAGRQSARVTWTPPAPNGQPITS